MQMLFNSCIFLFTVIRIRGMQIIQVPDEEQESNRLSSQFSTTEDSVQNNTLINELEIANISVYYESLCPDCRLFFVSQLLPVIARLFQNVNIELVPYGHAKSTHLANGTIEFKCQHGPAECYGNKLHACAMDKLRRPPWFAPIFNACLMAQSERGSNDHALTSCGQLMSVQVDSIGVCARGAEGDQLLDKYGKETNKYNPRSVPFILLNNSSDNQDELVENLLRAVCKIFHVKPSGCNSN